MDNKTTLQLYREICEINKNELITLVNRAVNEHGFTLTEETDKQRFFTLLTTLIEERNAAGYEILLNRLK